MHPFTAALLEWHGDHGRRQLPWRGESDPYRVWLSEIMLQQTQATTVVPYYHRFLERAPNVAALAAAPADVVMGLWSGLGYYARARNLHRSAQIIMSEFGGALPRSASQIAALPGVGRSTANAIAVFCFGAREPILDGNVKRVLCRLLGIAGYPGAAAIQQQLWRHAAELMPSQRAAAYIQAQMDLGAMICLRGKPRCGECPAAGVCVARRDGRTAELPTPRPRREQPWREATLLLLRHEGQVLLQRRPPSGVWGGLWSLPELPAGRDVDEFAASLGVRLLSKHRGEPLTHVFTHFRLRMSPLVCEAAPLAATAEPGRRWFDAAARAAAGLPAPVRRLLNATP